MVKVANDTFKKDVVSQEAELRYERKFIVNNTYLDDLIEQLKSSSFCFHEIYYERKINNVYFDDYYLNFFHQNESGIGKREKYRLRWYGNEFSKIVSPSIEIKRRDGEVGTKLKRKLKNLSFNLDDYSATSLIEFLRDNLHDYAFLLNKFYQLQPTLYSSYTRRYFLSNCGKFRVTLDFDQEFYNPYYPKYINSKKQLSESSIVLELKYELKDDAESRHIPQEFNWRLSKNSKYVNGVNLIHNLF